MTQPYMEGKHNKDIVEGLENVLADTFVLYFKTHTYHWNVTGKQFRSLHEMFDEQYTELWTAVDVIAERIRTLREFAPVNLNTLVGKASLNEAGQLPDACEMTRQLAEDNRAIVSTIMPALKAAQDAGDEATADLLIGRIDIHEKTAWMLESMAE